MKLTKNQINAIEKIFSTLELGGVTNIKAIESIQNILYKIETEKKTYILKEYSENSIKMWEQQSIIFMRNCCCSRT